jgi:hypothetical protein
VNAPTQMNLKRGLLRLWIVLALIWVGATTWFLWSDLLSIVPVFVVRSSNGREFVARVTGEDADNAQAIDVIKALKEELETGRRGKPEVKPEERTSLLAEVEAYEKVHTFTIDGNTDTAQRDVTKKPSAEKMVAVTRKTFANWPHRREAIVAIFLPPLGLLILGIGFFWVAQGFRKNSAAGDQS